MVAYADPPYVGKAAMYGVAETIDHTRFIVHLDKTFPDGWAYSLGTNALREAMNAAPTARVAAWVKPWAIFRPGVNPAYAWEPVLFKAARKGQRGRATVRDYVVANAIMKGGVKGSKPEEFAYWLFDLLQLDPDDDFIDLFPGSGRVSRCWEQWKSRWVVCEGSA